MRRQIVIGKMKRFKIAEIIYDDNRSIQIDHKRIKYHDYYLIHDNCGFLFTLYYDHIININRLEQ
mgnify:CR=1 FL=1